jgi:hypothetical protein
VGGAWVSVWPCCCSSPGADDAPFLITTAPCTDARTRASLTSFFHRSNKKKLSIGLRPTNQISLDHLRVGPLLVRAWQPIAAARDLGGDWPVVCARSAADSVKPFFSASGDRCVVHAPHFFLTTEEGQQNDVTGAAPTRSAACSAHVCNHCGPRLIHRSGGKLITRGPHVHTNQVARFRPRPASRGFSSLDQTALPGARRPTSDLDWYKPFRF